MEWIDNIIIGLIESFSTNNVYELCDVFDIQIVKLNKYNPILRKKDALYNRYENGYEVIFIRNDLHEKIEEFILKHELGHALCHPGLLSAAYAFPNKVKMERQANYFAFKLSNITLDDVSLKELTLEQIAGFIEVPTEVLNQLYAR